jgi:hypothetical protein
MLSATAFFLFPDFLYHAAVDCANNAGSDAIGDWLSGWQGPDRRA